LLATPEKDPKGRPGWKRLLWKGVLAAAAATTVAAYTVETDTAKIAERCIDNGVTKYGSSTESAQLAQLVQDYSTLWTEPKKHAITPFTEELTIPLIENW
jgi:hypothetical protein